MPKKLVLGAYRARPNPSRASAAAINLQKAARALQGRKAAKMQKAKSNRQLTRSVASLKARQNGEIQMARHQARWIGTLNYRPDQPSNIRPICFLHQAISEGSNIHTLEYSPAGAGLPAELKTVVAGQWVEQTLPTLGQLGLLPADYDRFDQLNNWRVSSTGGVNGPRFFHHSTLYTLTCKALACRGYIDVFCVKPKISFVRSTQKDINLPTGLVGFTHMSVGDNTPYQINPTYYSVKRLKRKYFNTVDGPGMVRELQTNPDFDINFEIKNTKAQQNITSSEVASGGVLEYSEIPYRKQAWIVVSVTLENGDVAPDNNITIKMNRVPKWRDYFGGIA